jgi:hypothetical protein
MWNGHKIYRLHDTVLAPSRNFLFHHCNRGSVANSSVRRVAIGCLFCLFFLLTTNQYRKYLRERTQVYMNNIQWIIVLEGTISHYTRTLRDIHTFIILTAFLLVEYLIVFTIQFNLFIFRWEHFYFYFVNLHLWIWNLAKRRN